MKVKIFYHWVIKGDFEEIINNFMVGKKIFSVHHFLAGSAHTNPHGGNLSIISIWYEDAEETAPASPQPGKDGVQL